MVRKERLELSHLAAPEPKSGASTNSAISAYILYIELNQIWCGRRDLNSHTLRRQNLNLVRLPIPPLPRLELYKLSVNW